MMMDSNKVNLREKLHELAQTAFHQQLISGHGDSEYSNQYQITYQGKTRHLPLKQAYNFLTELMKKRTDDASLTGYFHHSEV